jgi:hypothetical protein
MKVLLTYFAASWLIQMLLMIVGSLFGSGGPIYFLYVLPWLFLVAAYPELKPLLNENSLFLIASIAITAYSTLFAGVFGGLHLWLIGNKLRD